MVPEKRQTPKKYSENEIKTIKQKEYQKKTLARIDATIRFKTDGADPTISLLHFKKSTLQLRTRRGGGHCYILFPSEKNIQR